MNDRRQHSTLDILWLLALVLFTPVAGLLLNRDAFSGRSVLLMLIWTAVLLTPYVLTHKKWLYITATSLLFVDGLINLFHWTVLKCPLNASSIFVFLNTNFDEASEFMAIKMTPLLLLYIPYSVLFILTLKKIPPLSFRRRGEIAVWSALWLAAAVYFADNMVHHRFLRLAVPDVERAFVSFLEESREYKNLRTRELYSVEAGLTTNDSTLVVVIIGESCNRNHMSLYGYTRETTPRLQARSDLMVFDDVISANANTLRSVMNFLTENNMEHQRPLDSCIHIFDILHSSPYKSHWFSNQSPIGLWDNGVTSLAQNADVKRFVNITANSSKESTMTISLDERLLDPLESAIGDTAKHRIVFLHLMGCHTQYNKRYPKGFALFEERGDKRTRIVDTYDNAVLYNDFIVDSIFTVLNDYSLSHSGVRISALYFSDHGENVFDEGDYAGHDYSDHIPDADVEIPFILWFSPSQKEYLNSRNSPIATRMHTPYMIDDLFHTIIDLCCIATPCFDSTRSFISNSYNERRPRTLEDGSMYNSQKQ